jgi:hypothetical protein
VWVELKIEDIKRENNLRQSGMHVLNQREIDSCAEIERGQKTIQPLQLFWKEFLKVMEHRLCKENTWQTA